MSFRTPTALLTGVALLIGCGEGRPDVRPMEEEVVAPPYTDITVAQLQEMMVERDFVLVNVHVPEPLRAHHRPVGSMLQLLVRPILPPHQHRPQ